MDRLLNGSPDLATICPPLGHSQGPAHTAREPLTVSARTFISDAFLAARFLIDMPAFYRHRFGPAEARLTLQRRFRNRQALFLQLLGQVLTPRPGNPYPGLFAQAGMQAGDVEALLRFEGIEGALETLYRSGIYLTSEEFKGRQPIRRGSATITGSSAGLLNPIMRFPIVRSSSGAVRGLTIVPVDLRFVHAFSVNSCLHLDARRGNRWVRTLWAAPGSNALAGLLEHSAYGVPLASYFRLVDPSSIRLHARYIWSERAMRSLSAALGVHLPEPRLAPPDDPAPLLRWLLDVRAAGNEPHVRCFTTMAVSLALEAAARGTDLSGMHFTTSGEPLTEARKATLVRAGADVVQRFGATGAGLVAQGCLSPRAVDDQHLMDDLLAAVAVPKLSGDAPLPEGALLLSGLHPAAPCLMINVSFGDAANLTRRSCGCPLDRLGWRTHIESVRSFEKLTSGGMNYPDSEVSRILETVLPARFGGSPGSYQLVETEDLHGQARLHLVADPALGALDSSEVSEALLTAVGHGSGIEHLTAALWRQAGIVRVERRRPYRTTRGKSLLLHRLNAAASMAGLEPH